PASRTRRTADHETRVDARSSAFVKPAESNVNLRMRWPGLRPRTCLMGCHQNIAQKNKERAVYGPDPHISKRDTSVPHARENYNAKRKEQKRIHTGQRAAKDRELSRPKNARRNRIRHRNRWQAASRVVRHLAPLPR